MKKLQKLVAPDRLVHIRGLMEIVARDHCGGDLLEAARTIGAMLAENRTMLYGFPPGDPVAIKASDEQLESLYCSDQFHSLILSEDCAISLDDVLPLFGYEPPDGMRLVRGPQTRRAPQTETPATDPPATLARQNVRDSSLVATIAALMAAWPGGTPPSGKDLEKAANSVGLTISDDTLRKALGLAKDIAPSVRVPK